MYTSATACRFPLSMRLARLRNIARLRKQRGNDSEPTNNYIEQCIEYKQKVLAA